jgi:hypothetical protein
MTTAELRTERGRLVDDAADRATRTAAGADESRCDGRIGRLKAADLDEDRPSVDRLTDRVELISVEPGPSVVGGPVMHADHSEQQRRRRELDTCCAGHSNDLAGPGYQPELPRGGHGSVRPVAASAIRLAARPCVVRPDAVAVPHRVMLRLPVEASDRWVLVTSFGTGLATSVETPVNSVHHECDQCKLQIWMWHTGEIGHHLWDFAGLASSVRVTLPGTTTAKIPMGRCTLADSRRGGGDDAPAVCRPPCGWCWNV